MRAAWLHHLIASVPLLACLAWMAWAFPGESAAADHFARLMGDNPGLKAVLEWVSVLGNPLFYAVYAAILLRGLATRRPGLTRLALVYVAVQLVVSLLLVRLLKISLGKPRPGEGLLFQPMTLEPSNHAFPSGHTCEVTAAAAPLAMWRRRVLLSLGLGLVIAAVGASRILLGWHHPSDVFFGWLLGSAGALAIHLFGVLHAGR
jgi:undecaprenyl-diphosphatase